MEKPFKCPITNCDLSFVNEDHLTVHKKKHELSLTLTPTPSFKNPFLIDQTPTPTRFLNALESLEFQDLNENPFDATFRRANSTGGSRNIDIPESLSLISNLPDSEVLNTPSITVPSEPATPISLKPNFPKKRSVPQSSDLDSAANNNDSQPFSAPELIVPDVVPQKKSSAAEFLTEGADANNFNYPISESEGAVHKQDKSRNVLQTSVITSIGNSTVLKSNAVGVPTAVVVTRPAISNIQTVNTSQVPGITKSVNQIKVAETAPTIVQPLCVAPVVQLMIRLPDGQTVQLPVMASATTTGQPQTVAPVVPLPQVAPAPATNAKMKLKEVLVSGKKSGTTVKTVFKDGIQSDDSFGLSSPPLSPIPKKQGRKRRDFSDPEEKRKRCLERNRAAATRCREKRKMWVTALERKADEMARINAQLQSEVQHLRNEVANLKTMLLAHKDCPVTVQQKAQYNYERENCTTIRIITCSSEDVQLVPNNPAVSPLNSEYLEMEVSSVQSSSDTSSLASEASELSYKER